MNWNTAGYHGTNPVAAKQILTQNKFLPTVEEDAWLGKGVYFFTSEEDAYWWCSKCKNIIPFSVLKAEIEPTVVLDLVTSLEDSRNFKIACDMVKHMCARTGKGKPRANYMSLALKHMLKVAPKPDIIVGGFCKNRDVYNKYEDKIKFPYETVQVQICVLNSECIKEICLHKEVG